MFFALLKTRYDINLVAAGNISSASAHIEFQRNISKISQRFISMKKRQISLSKSVVFSGTDVLIGFTHKCRKIKGFKNSFSEISRFARYEIILTNYEIFC